MDDPQRLALQTAEPHADIREPSPLTLQAAYLSGSEYPCRFCGRPIPPDRVKAALRVKATPSSCTNSHRALACTARRKARQ
jgi:hypothetical protein